MTTKNLEAIQTLRKQNYSYASIAKALGMNMNTVKSLCRRGGIETPDMPRKTKAEKQMLQVCKQCGSPISNEWHRRQKSFCSDKCRLIYWKSHKTLENKASGSSMPAVPEGAKPSNNSPGKGLDSSALQSYAGAKEVSAYGNTPNSAH